MFAKWKWVRSYQFIIAHHYDTLLPYLPVPRTQVTIWRMSAPTLLERMVEPIGRALTPVAATELLRVRADQETQRRIDELADKCNDGTLTADERAEYQEFVSLFNILTVLQARARTVLEAHNGL
jgi:hypothetical protein